MMVEIDPDVAAVWEAVVSGKAEALAERIESFRLTEENVTSVLSAPASVVCWKNGNRNEVRSETVLRQIGQRSRWTITTSSFFLVGKAFRQYQP